MKIYKISQNFAEDSDEINLENLKSISDIERLTPVFAEKAQKIYDEWDEEDIDTYAGGGICHLIADEMTEVMWNNGIENQTYSSDSEQHVYCIALVKEGVYAVDIHYSLYERGGGYSWKKLPEVEFSPEWVSLYCITTDINEWKNIVE